MLFLKKQQKKEAEWKARVDVFSKELKELCEGHGIDIRAKITPYQPVLELFEIPKKEASK